jgi:hypothetical protein
MSFQANPSLAGLSVGSKEVTVPLMSEAPKRLASRRPSRPKIALPIARGKGVGVGLIVNIVLNVVTKEGSTLPLCETRAFVRPKSTLPLALPVTVMRTGGRK